ncbi:MAG TPA: HNH endonuclease [Candidatus Acidoferrum sp.]|nr:HNH endonuclease [Candidatus Acidoferrum sp.]
MKNKKLDALLIWKQIEDQLIPRLRLNLVERVVYYHLLRHTRLESQLRLRFSIQWLTRGVRLSEAPARQAVRTLVEKGALRLLERTRAGHVVEVLLPDEIHAAAPDGPVPGCLARRPRTAGIEEADFLRTKTRRAAIHARDGGLCFYCLTQLTPRTRCLDHVIPLARRGKNSYRNLVSCCTECNTQKGETAADDFLRTLCRQRRITSAELANRLRALDALAAGELRPVLPAPQPKFVAGAPKPTPPSYKRFPVGSMSYPRPQDQKTREEH